MNLRSHISFDAFALNESKTRNISISELKKLFKKEHIFILMGGAPGAGKSYVINKEFGSNVNVLDHDKFVSELGGSTHDDYKKNGGKARINIRKKSDYYLKHKISFIKQAVSANISAAIKQEAQAKDKGFITVFFFIDVPLADAIERNKIRVENGERSSLIPEYVITRKFNDAKKTANQIFNSDIFDYVIRYKNNS